MALPGHPITLDTTVFPIFSKGEYRCPETNPYFMNNFHDYTASGKDWWIVVGYSNELKKWGLHVSSYDEGLLIDDRLLTEEDAAQLLAATQEAVLLMKLCNTLGGF